jgi:carboxypeptidase Q
MTHHSNQDFYERLVEQDLQRTAVIVATFVYHTAMLDEKLHRKESKIEIPASASI